MYSYIEDLHAKGLLGPTPMVLGTEFGRTPRIYDNDGRDQHKAFTCLLAGVGIEGETPTATASSGPRAQPRSWTRR